MIYFISGIILIVVDFQEASVLRRKVEELMTESETAKRQVKELTERLALKSAPKKILPSTGKATTLSEQKIKVLILFLNKSFY